MGWMRELGWSCLVLALDRRMLVIWRFSWLWIEAEFEGEPLAVDGDLGAAKDFSWFRLRFAVEQTHDSFSACALKPTRARSGRNRAQRI